MKTVLLSLLMLAIPAQQFKVQHTDAEWQKMLPKKSYLVMRKAATEKPYTGAFWDFHEAGTYACKGCGQVIFSSDAKFDSHTGWPSFYQTIAKDRIITRPDDSEGTRRTEVICSRCGSHFGHVFEDGPQPTGLRYCMNSAAFNFIPKGMKKR
ncbi:MAG: peptide-methionine (R)-S-oxide reductase MsrB [Armatimonadetes bacterium]|nr:peptide-methionine (R)-S-oxide reductase MsrB [Armatimonadota bacterium]